MKLTDDQKKEIIKSRYSEDDFLKRILELTVKKMENNPYCRRILNGANYYEQERPDQFDPYGFYLEDIYVGKPSWGPSGHCTKERYQFGKVGDENTNGTRDVAYISEDTIKHFVFEAIKKLNIDIPLAEEIPEGANFEDFCALPEMSKDIYKKTKNPYILSLYNYHKLQEDIEKIKNNDEFMNYLSDVLLNTVAHECSHANQMNNGSEWEAQNSCALPFNTSEEREDYVDEIRKVKNVPDSELQHSLRSAEVVAEAGVMAHSYVAMLLTINDERAIETVNSTYEPRCDISKINPDMKKIRATDEDGNYTPEAIKEQQRIAREIFSGVCEKYGAYQMRIVQKHTNCSEVPNVDYNCDVTFTDIKSSYQEYIFGPIDEYIKAIPEPGLSDERKAELKEFAENRKSKTNKKTIDNPVPKLSIQAKEEIKKEKHAKTEVARVRGMLPSQRDNKSGTTKRAPEKSKNNPFVDDRFTL